MNNKQQAPKMKWMEAFHPPKAVGQAIRPKHPAPVIAPRMPPPPSEVELAKLRKEVRRLRTRRQPSMVVPILGTVFAILGIFTFGPLFLPLAALCAIGGIVGGIVDLSPVKVIISLMVAGLTVVGFILSPTAQLAALAIFAASGCVSLTRDRSRMGTSFAWACPDLRGQLDGRSVGAWHRPGMAVRGGRDRCNRHRAVLHLRHPEMADGCHRLHLPQRGAHHRGSHVPRCRWLPTRHGYG